MRPFARLTFVVRLFDRTISRFGWLKGIELAIRQLRSRATIAKVSVSGHRLQMRLGRRQSDLVTAIHVFFDDEYEMPIEAARWIVDAGSNVGYSVLWFADRYPQAEIIAIEPEPGNIEMLTKNVGHLTKCRIVQGALAAESGTAEMFDVGSPDSMRVGIAGQGHGTGTGRVECFSLEAIMEKYSIDRIDILKMDIEGAELEIFENAKGWIDRVDAIAIELHDRFRPGCTNAFARSTQDFSDEFTRGENTFVLRREAKTGSFDLGVG